MSEKLCLIKQDTIKSLGEKLKKLINYNDKITFASLLESLDNNVNYYEQILNNYIAGNISGEFTYNGLGEIRDYGFYGFNNMTTFNAPNATLLGLSALGGCTSLTKVHAPKVTKMNSSFNEAVSLSDLNIGLIVDIWGSSKNSQYINFYNNSYIQNLSLPGITTIAKQAFYNCIKLETFYTEGQGIINEGAFQKCSSLSSMQATKITSIGKNAFKECSKLTVLNFPNVTNAGDTAFVGCPVVEINMPMLIKSGSNTFQSLSTLQKVNWGFSTATNIGNQANLKRIIMSNATTIKEKAFSQCPNLEEVYFNSISAITVEANAFANCRKLTWENIFMPNLTTLNDNAFSGCTNLSYIEMPNLTTIKKNPFNGCTSLSYAYLGCPNIPTTNIFLNTGIERLYLPKCTELKSQCFTGCTSLKYISMPEVTTIQSNALSGCTNLNHLFLPACANIQKQAFAGCTSLKEIRLYGSSKANIATDAFQGIDPSTIKVYVKDELYNTYMEDATWKQCNIIPIIDFAAMDFTIRELSNEIVCYKIKIENNDETINDIFIGSNDSSPVKGLFLYAPYYDSEGNLETDIQKLAYYTIVDNKKFVGPKYVYNKEKEIYEPQEIERFLYYSEEYDKHTKNELIKIEDFSSPIFEENSNTNFTKYYWWID